MTVRTEQVDPTASRPATHPIRFSEAGRASLGERIVAAARVASAMHLTGAALIAADEDAIRALEARETTKRCCR